MKFTAILVVMCVVLCVAMAARPNKKRLTAKMAAKKEARKAKNEQCPMTVTWTACDAATDQITQTVTVPEGCKPKLPLTFNCTISQTREKRGCKYNRTADLTPCGAGAKEFATTMTAEPATCVIPEHKKNNMMSCDRYLKALKKGEKKMRRRGKGGKKHGGKRQKNRRERLGRGKNKKQN